MRYLRRLATTVERGADRPFLIDAASGRTLTYAETHERATAVARELRARGLTRGERLAVAAPNSVDLALLYLGALYAGVVVVPLGSGFGRRELRSILDRAAPELLVVSGDERTRLEPLAGEGGLALADLGEGGDVDPWRATEPAGDWEPFDGAADDDLAAIHFTSGTTGVPRGVGHRVRNFVANAERYAGAVGLDDSHRLHATLPMTYMAGYYNLLLLPFSIGASVVLDRAFDARSLLRFWDAPERHGADVLWLVPTIAAMLLEVDRGDRGADWCREHVRLAICGTAPLDPDLRARFEERYGVALHDSYGLSEALLSVASTPSQPASPGSVGRPLPGVEVQAGDAESGPAAVRLATPDVMVGYLIDSRGGPRFDSPLADGRWLDTGDAGVIDADGELRITGRIKEIIIRGGVNVSPAEVERVLESHDAVERTAVVGIPHDILGEEIAAVVVCRDGGGLDTVEPELRALARDRLEDSQQPGVYVQIDELPLTATGKIRKAALRDVVIDRLGLPDRGKRFTIGELEEPEPQPQGGRLVDLSHELREGMTTFASPNHPRVEITQLGRHHIEGRATRRLVLGTHTGTHLDAPLHFIPDGAGVESLALDALVGPAHVVDLTEVGPLEEVSAERLKRALGGRLEHPRLLLRYDWSRRFDSAEFYSQSPYLAYEACRWLVDQGVRLIGMDTPSPDDPRNDFGSGNDSPNHFLLLGAGVILLEYLNNLAALRSPEVKLVALPLLVPGADGAPARVIAIDP